MDSSKDIKFLLGVVVACSVAVLCVDAGTHCMTTKPKQPSSCYQAPQIPEIPRCDRPYHATQQPCGLCDDYHCHVPRYYDHIQPQCGCESLRRNGGHLYSEYPSDLSKIDLPCKLAAITKRRDAGRDEEDGLLKMSTAEFALKQARDLVNHIAHRRLPLLKIKKDNLLGLFAPEKLEKAREYREDSCCDNRVSKY